MKFLSLVVALLIEQARPLRQTNGAYQLFEHYAAVLERQLNGGQFRHGAIAWMLAVIPAAVLVLAVSLLLAGVSAPLAWAWNVAVLYLTMGFRQFSHDYTEITHALQEGHLDSARDRLGRWRGESALSFSAGEVARVAIELGFIGAHRHVFGPVACFIAFGPAGAVVYRLAAMLATRWGGRTDPEFGAFGQFAARFFCWLDWLPTRLTAASFAIAGNFEDAVYCWRTQARAWATHAHGIILASGAGAVGVRLGDPLHYHDGMQFRPELGMGEAADVDYMQSAVGLVWRALVLWMFLLLLVTIARSLG